jgi:hypothetical protein
MNNKKKYKCPCCGYYTLDYGPGHFDICPVCYWEDDNIQADDPTYWGGANVISLNEARENYKKFGASEECFLDSVRPPTEEEKIIPPIEPINDEVKELSIQEQKLDLIRQYNNIQGLLGCTGIEPERRKNFQDHAKLIVKELKNSGIVLDEATGSFIDILTGLPVMANSVNNKKS